MGLQITKGIELKKVSKLTVLYLIRIRVHVRDFHTRERTFPLTAYYDAHIIYVMYIV